MPLRAPCSPLCSRSHPPFGKGTPTIARARRGASSLCGRLPRIRENLVPLVLVRLSRLGLRWRGWVLLFHRLRHFLGNRANGVHEPLNPSRSVPGGLRRGWRFGRLCGWGRIGGWGRLRGRISLRLVCQFPPSIPLAFLGIPLPNHGANREGEALERPGSGPRTHLEGTIPVRLSVRRLPDYRTPPSAE